MQLPFEVILDIAGFIGRRSLETVFAAAGRRPAALVRRYFPLRPYLIIDQLEIRLRDRSVTFTQNGAQSMYCVDFQTFREEFCAGGRVPPYLRVVKICVHCSAADYKSVYDILDALNPAFVDADVRLIFFNRDLNFMRRMLAHVQAPSITIIGWQYSQLADLFACPTVADERCVQLLHCRRSTAVNGGFEALARSCAAAIAWLQNDTSNENDNKNENESSRHRTLRIGGRNIFDWVEHQMIEAFLTDPKPHEFVAQFGLLNIVPAVSSPYTRHISNPATGETLLIAQHDCQTFVRRSIMA